MMNKLRKLIPFTRKAKTLQMDMNDVLGDIVELSQNVNNKIKGQLRIERLTQYREGYLQLRNRTIALIAEERKSFVVGKVFWML